MAYNNETQTEDEGRALFLLSVEGRNADDWIPWSVDHRGLIWNNGKTDPPTQAEVDAKIAEFKAADLANAYKELRRKEYPQIGDQLDDLYKKGAFSDEMAEKIKKVKDDNPKS